MTNSAIHANRWVRAVASATVLASLAAGLLSGCQDRKARKQMDASLAVARRERDELARQLYKSQSELTAAKSMAEQLSAELRMAQVEADTGRANKITSDREAGKLRAELDSRQAQYASLQDKNQVLEGELAELRKVVQVLQRSFDEPAGGATTSSQPDILRLPGHEGG